MSKEATRNDFKFDGRAIFNGDELMWDDIRSREGEIIIELLEDRESLAIHLSETGPVIAALQSALRQAKAERDRVMRLLENLTPGGSEYVNDPERCAATITETKRTQHELIVKFKKERDTAVLSLARLTDENEKLMMAVKVAVVQLWDTHPEDVERVFSLEELKQIVSDTSGLQDKRVEEIYHDALALSHAASGKDEK